MKTELKVFKLTMESEKTQIASLQKELLRLLQRAAEVLTLGEVPNLDLARITTVTEELKMRSLKLRTLMDVQTELEFLEQDRQKANQ